MFCALFLYKYLRAFVSILLAFFIIDCICLSAYTIFSFQLENDRRTVSNVVFLTLNLILMGINTGVNTYKLHQP